MARLTDEGNLEMAMKKFSNERRKLDFLLGFRYESLYEIASYYELEFMAKKSVTNKFIVAKKLAKYGSIQEYWAVLMGYDPLKKQSSN